MKGLMMINPFMPPPPPPSKNDHLHLTSSESSTLATTTVRRSQKGGGGVGRQRLLPRNCGKPPTPGKQAPHATLQFCRRHLAHTPHAPSAPARRSTSIVITASISSVPVPRGTSTLFAAAAAAAIPMRCCTLRAPDGAANDTRLAATFTWATGARGTIAAAEHLNAGAAAPVEKASIESRTPRSELGSISVCQPSRFSNK